VKNKTTLLILIALLALVTACAQSDEASMSFDAIGAPEMAEEAPSEAEYDSSVSNDTLKVSLQSQEGPQRLIIRSGDLAIVVEDSEASAQAIAALAAGLDGWLVESDLYESNGVKRGSVTIRIPADHLSLSV
jgi:hypothetical protein